MDKWTVNKARLHRPTVDIKCPDGYIYVCRLEGGAYGPKVRLVFTFHGLTVIVAEVMWKRVIEALNSNKALQL